MLDRSKKEKWIDFVRIQSELRIRIRILISFVLRESENRTADRYAPTQIMFVSNLMRERVRPTSCVIKANNHSVRNFARA